MRGIKWNKNIIKQFISLLEYKLYYNIFGGVSNEHVDPPTSLAARGHILESQKEKLGHAVKCCAALLLNLWTTKTKRLCIRSRKDSSSLFKIHEKWGII